MTRNSQQQGPQAIDRKPIRLNRRVPSVLPLERRLEVIGEVRAGRSIHQTAKAYSVSEVVVLELYVRDLELRIARRLAA